MFTLDRRRPRTLKLSSGEIFWLLIGLYKLEASPVSC